MAGPPVDLKIKGIKQLEAGARDLFANIDRAEGTDAVGVTAEQVAASIRARVPRRSGRLAASVQVTRRANIASVEMGAGLAYAKWIEFGVRKGKQPRRGRFVYPTAKRTERAFRKHAELVCAREIGGMRWPTPH